MSELGKKCRQSPSEEFEKQTKMKIMGYLRHSPFDPQPVIIGFVNELIDYCVKPGLIIASSIINDIIGEFENESRMHYQEKHKFSDLQKYPIEKNKIPKSTFLRKLAYPIKICNTQLNKKGMGKIPNY